MRQKEENTRVLRNRKGQAPPVVVKQKRFNVNKNNIEYLVKESYGRAKWMAIDQLINYKAEVRTYDKFVKDIQAQGRPTFLQKGSFLLFQKQGEPLQEAPSMQQQFQQIGDIKSQTMSKLPSQPISRPTSSQKVSLFCSNDKLNTEKKSSYFSSPIIKIKAFMNNILTSVEKKIRKH